MKHGAVFLIYFFDIFYGFFISFNLKETVY